VLCLVAAVGEGVKGSGVFILGVESADEQWQSEAAPLTIRCGFDYPVANGTHHHRSNGGG